VVELLVGMGADEQAATLLGALTGSATAAEPYGDDVERLAVARATLAERLGPARLEAAIRAGAAVGDDRATAFALELIDQALSSRPA